ncbi:thiamine pyrophosphate-dependent dehydrogenase E1 component subunit alpha [Falsiroseomonas sp.]|uniref:thiamine pyrophosphate-dependent dehydrogenase E1 component subunit alpha n=1 Tax=Falsiroseomonas sp. TaxID=2870721 RepID=UPI00356723E1
MRRIANDLEPGALLRFLREMLRIRRFEEAAIEQARAGMLPGALHVCIGQEGVAVGVCAALQLTDTIVSTHRGHGHCLAKGGRMDRMFAELLGRRDGYCGGKGGSQHIADFSVGMLGANGIVGSSFAIAAGAALTAKRRGDGQVSVAFFGDGAASRGTFHEVMNIARLWRLPVLFVCEHNEYAQWVPAERNLAARDVAAFAAPFGIASTIIDGADVRAVHTAAAAAVAALRRGEGPVLLECKTHRFFGHTTADMQVYRAPARIGELRRTADPIGRLEAELRRAGLLDANARQEMEDAIALEVASAVAFALASPPPVPEDISTDILAWA